MTHAFNYGTAVFEGIRANWNADHEQLYLFRVAEHYQRLRRSAHVLMMGLAYSDEDLVQYTRQLVEKTGFREDLYIRPMVYKSQEVLGVRLHDVEDDLLIYASPFGAYLDIDAGIRCCTSSWRRTDDTTIPVRPRSTVSTSTPLLPRPKRIYTAFDEAIMLTHDGHVSEGSGENIFLMMDGKLYTPPSSDNILVGITRATVMELAARELGLETVSVASTAASSTWRTRSS